MNNEESDKKEQLLQDILGGETFDAFNAESKRRALAEFRRARLIRRTLATTGLAAILGLVVVAGLLAVQRRGRREVAMVHASTFTESGVPQTGSTKPPQSATPEIISEEQLVALFPAESCFVAEVDGKKRLVFRSPELRQQYLYEAN